MRKAVILLLLLATLQSRAQGNGRLHLLDFGSFTILVPQGWTKELRQGIDSYVGRVRIDSANALEFDLGYYSNSLQSDEDGKIKLTNVTVDGKAARIVRPVKPGHGNIGIYIPELWPGTKYNRTRFNLYGTNISPRYESQIIKALKTLKFYKDRKL